MSDDLVEGVACSRPSQSLWCPSPKSENYDWAYTPTGYAATEAKRQRVQRIHAGGPEIFTGDDIAELHRRHAKRST